MKNYRRLLATILTAALLPVFPVLASAEPEPAVCNSTGLAAMTDEEREALLTNIAPDDEVSLFTALPSNVDNSASKYFPPIGNQKNTNCCVAYASAYYQLTYEAAKAMNLDAKSGNIGFDPAWTYSFINGGSDNGSNFSDAYNALGYIGAKRMTTFTSAISSIRSNWIETDASVYRSALRYRIGANGGSYQTHYFRSANEFIESAKAQLTVGKIITTGTNSNRWSISTGSNGQKGVTHISSAATNTSADGRHAVTLVGYDDNISFNVGGTTVKGAFKLANSWGTSRSDHNNGFIWVSYGAFKNKSEGGYGYGFVSSWWDSDVSSTDNVFFTIDLADNYASYTPQYIGEYSVTNKNLRLARIAYKTKENASSQFVPYAGRNVFDASNFNLPSSSYTGTIAVDLTDVAPYVSDDTKYYEILDNGETNGSFRLTDGNGNTVATTKGSYKWIKPHAHIGILKNPAAISATQWTAKRVCGFCEETTDASGTRKTLTLSWSDNSFTYDGNDKRITPSISGIDADHPDVQVTASNSSAKNAGTYTAAAALTGADAPYYVLPTNNTKQFTIAPAKAYMKTEPKARNLTCSGELQDLVTSPSGVTGGDAYYRLKGETEWNTVIPCASNPGTYIVEYYVKSRTRNYTDSDIKSVTASIALGAPVSVTFTAPNKTEYYRGETALDFTGLTAVETYADGSTTTVPYNETDFALVGSISDTTTTVSFKYKNEWTYRYTITRLDTYVTGISVDVSGLKKTQYYTGDKLDLTGAKMLVTNNLGKQNVWEEIPSMYVKSADLSKAGEAVITVSYKGFEDTFTVTVIDAEYKDCEITLAKTKYFLNEAFGDNTVTKLVARYTNGSARRIDASDIVSVEINKYFSDRIGKRSLPVSVTTTDGKVYTSDVTIEIVPVEFTHIEFVPPTNRTYYVDSRADSFNPNGMRFIRHYNDGSYEITEAADADYELNFPIISDWQIGRQTDVHVIYDSTDYSFKIDVVESVPAEIRVKLYFTNYDPTMYTNQPFRAYDYEMQVISAAGIKSDWERLDRYDNYSVEGFDNLTPGTKTVRIVYQGCYSEPFEVEVEEQFVGAIRTVTPLDKSEYYEGEELDLTGLTLEKSYITRLNKNSDPYYADYVPVDADEIKYVYFRDEQYKDYGNDITALKAGKYYMSVCLKSGSGGRIPITILEPYVTGITVSAPFDTELYQGQSVNPAGAVIMEHYNTGKTVTIPVTEADCELSCDTSKIGAQTATVSYKGFTDTFTVNVLAPFVTGIEMTNPDKTEYYQNKDNLDLTGSVITEHYNNGTAKTVDASSAKLSFTFDNSAVGSQDVTVTYNGFTAVISVTVLEPYVESISISAPEKTEYYQNYDNLDLTGAVITEHYNTGIEKTVDVSDDNVTTDFSNTQAGEQTVTVTYKTFTASFTVTILEPFATGIEITAPSKTEYYQGETLDMTGFEAYEVTNTELHTPISVSDVTTDFDSSKIGSQTVTVMHNGFTASFTVTILEPYMTSIELEGTPSECGTPEADLNMSRLQIVEVFNTGVTRPVDMKTADYSVSDVYDGNGKRNVTVSYNGFTASFAVTVKKYLTNITVSAPDRTSYPQTYPLIPLDLTGSVVTEYYNTGETVTFDADTVDIVSNFDSMGQLDKYGYYIDLYNDETYVEQVTMEYKDYKSTVNITLTPAVYTSAEIRTLPNKLSYYQGETVENLDLTGIKFAIKESNGSVSTKTSGYSVTAFDSSEVGKTDVVVSIKGIETSFEVEILLPYTTAITVDAPSKTEYVQDEEFEPDGLQIYETTNMNTVITVDMETADYTTDFDSSQTGSHIVTVTYKGFTASFDVTVNTKPEPTAEPTIEPTPEPSDEPIVTPTPEPTEKPDEPVITPEPTEEPEITPEPTPDVTEEPAKTPEPSDEPEPTKTPEPPVDFDYVIETSVAYDAETGVCAYTAVNNTDADIEAVGIIAVYGEFGVLKHIETVNLFTVGETVTDIQCDISYGDTVKCFVWESFASMNPYANTNTTVFTIGDK